MTGSCSMTAVKYLKDHRLTGELEPGQRVTLVRDMARNVKVGTNTNVCKDFTITEKAPTRASSLMKTSISSAFTFFKTLFRH